MTLGCNCHTADCRWWVWKRSRTSWGKVWTTGLQSATKLKTFHGNVKAAVITAFHQ